MRKALIVFLSLIYLSVALSEVDPFQDLNEKTHKLNQSLDESIATPMPPPIHKVARPLSASSRCIP